MLLYFRRGLTLLLIFLMTGCQVPANKQEKADQPIRQSAPTVANNAAVIKLIDDPLDSSVSYYLEFNGKDQEAQAVIAGAYWRGVRLLEVNKGGHRKNLIEDLPFITRARWSPDGKYLGLMGAEKLYLWERSTGKVTLVNQAVNTPSITHFAFGPDNKIYTEHENLPNDAVYDPSTGQGSPAYKISGRPLYYKEALGSGLYAGTVVKDGTKTSVEEVHTVIADAQGQVIKRVMPGRYRDHMDKALLNVGTEHFGLYYAADYNQSSPVTVYSGYVYQCKLAADGGVIYTRPGSGDKPYYLCKYWPATGKTMEAAVSGPFFAVDAASNLIFGGGWQAEQLNLSDLTLKTHMPPPSVTHPEVIKAVLGAVNSYHQFYFHPSADAEQRKQDLARWYTDTEEPRQCALFDVNQELADRITSSYYYGDHHALVKLNSLVVKGEKASAVIGLGVRTSSGSGWGYESAYELVKTSEGWKVTGLSTFPDSGEHQRVAAAVKRFLEQAWRGENVNFRNQDSPRVYQKIKQKQVEMGQIQFWRMSEPHRSPNVETSNYAKVYITANGKTYKLVLEKKSYSWVVIGLSDRNLSRL